MIEGREEKIMQYLLIQVVSLLDYDDIGSTSLDLVSPGYPVVCVTVCLKGFQF